MSGHQWKCTDPVLQSYEFGEFHAQRTWRDTAALWRAGVKLGEYGNLTLAWDAMEAMSEQPSEQKPAVRIESNETK